MHIFTRKSLASASGNLAIPFSHLYYISTLHTLIKTFKSFADDGIFSEIAYYKKKRR